jgi:hypothetical protein
VAAVVVPPALLAGVSAAEVPTERLWSEDPRSLRLQWRVVAGAVATLTAKLTAAGVPLKVAMTRRFIHAPLSIFV